MHILIDNISHTVTGQTLLLEVNRKSHLGFRLAYLHLTLAHSNGQGQGQSYLECENLLRGDRYRVNIAIVVKN